jgi:hypothetical protein
MTGGLEERPNIEGSITIMYIKYLEEESKSFKYTDTVCT